jgi:serine/threonine-protein kinase
MTAEDYKKVKELFLAALEMPQQERVPFVTSAVNGNKEMLKEVEGLLAEHARGSKLMPTDPEGPLGPMSAILSRAGVEMPKGEEPLSAVEIPAGADNPIDSRGTETRLLDEATDQSTGSRSGIVDAGRFMAGTVVAGRYRIIEMLGRGGMGEVYRADDLTLNQSVALKFLPALFGQDAKWLDRFHNEVRLARQVTHPNVCRVFDIGEFQGDHFISMEYVDGENLASLLRRIGRVPEDKALLLARQLCAGLSAAHERGVLHRDLKPANVMIDGRGAVRITDFGLAAPMDEMREQAGARGVRAGTPAYMSPEQLAGRSVTVRSDVYSLGLVLYEMFTGKRAVKADSLRGYQKAHSSEQPTPPSEIVDDIDPIVDRAIMRCLEKDPKDRPASVMAVLAALPGGNPLREMLAAGETPSPEMVAAAGEAMGAMKPRTAIALLVTALVCLIGFVFAAPSIFVVQRALGDRVRSDGLTAKEPAVLADRAQSILRDLGHITSPRDTAYGFDVNRGYYLHVDKDFQGTDRIRRLWRPRLGLVYFWYRQSPEPLIPLRPESSVEERDPPAMPGMIRMRLDPLGRLTALEVHSLPPQHSSTTQPAAGAATVPASASLPSATAATTPTTPTTASSGTNWAALLAAAQIDLSKEEIREVEPTGSPPVYADERRAWEGMFADARGESVHIEAAAFRGKPVYFAIIGTWHEEKLSEDQAQVLSVGKLNLILQTLVTAALLIAGGALAIKNYRSGRGDRPGAARMALAFFVFGIVGWVLSAHHVSDPVFEFIVFRRGVGAVMYAVAMIWIFYMALEPYVRRVWPEAMISWSRLLAGKWIDPLVGRDVLAGAAVGVMTTLLTFVEYRIPIWLGERIMPVPLPSITSVSAMLGAVQNYSGIFNSATAALSGGLIMLLFLVLTRMAIRRWWPSAIIAAIVFALATARYNAQGDWWRFGPENVLSLIMQMLLAIALLVVLSRHGLVALVFCMLTRSLLLDFPVTSDIREWYFGASMLGIVPTLIILGVAFYAAMNGRGMAALKRE